MHNALMPAAGDGLLSNFVFLILFGSWEKAQQRNPQPPYVRVVTINKLLHSQQPKRKHQNCSNQLEDNFK